MFKTIKIPAAATLTTSYIGRPCPGETVTFSCTVPGVEVFWDPNDANLISINPMSSPVTEGQYTAIFISSNATSITSSLSTTARDDVMVECLSVGSVTIRVAGGSFHHVYVSSCACFCTVCVLERLLDELYYA